MNHPPIRASAIVPHVILPVELPKTYYAVAAIARVSVLYHTASTVRVRLNGADVNKAPGRVWCCPDDASWDRVVSTRNRYEVALAELAAALEGAGLYKPVRDGWEARHGTKPPNPLSAWVVANWGLGPGGWGLGSEATSEECAMGGEGKRREARSHTRREWSAGR